MTCRCTSVNIKVETTSSTRKQLSDMAPRRAQSFATEPLHSAAYLNNLVTYLDKQPCRPNRFRPTPSPAPAESNFLYTYNTAGSSVPKLASFSRTSEFLDIGVASDAPRLILLTGSPSPEWLNAVVDHFSVDPRFLHSHLDFIPNAQRDWYTSSTLPSRSRNVFRLLVPSIVFVGLEGRSLSVDELHHARTSCAIQLRNRSKTILSGQSTPSGQSIVRQVNIHRGDAIVMEQVVSVTIMGTGKAHRSESDMRFSCGPSFLTQL
jgi:hypothetical protein